MNRVALEWLASLEAHRLCARQFESAEFPNPWELRQFFRNSAMRFSVFSLLSCPHYSFAALTFAHLARFAALIRARPAAEMWRFGAIETTFWPLVFAQRAF